MLSTVKLGSPSVSICEVSASAILVTVILEDVYSCRKLLFFFPIPKHKKPSSCSVDFPLCDRFLRYFSGQFACSSVPLAGPARHKHTTSGRRYASSRQHSMLALTLLLPGQLEFYHRSDSTSTCALCRFPLSESGLEGECFHHRIPTSSSLRYPLLKPMSLSQEEAAWQQSFFASLSSVPQHLSLLHFDPSSAQSYTVRVSLLHLFRL